MIFGTKLKVYSNLKQALKFGNKTGTKFSHFHVGIYDQTLLNSLELKVQYCD